MAKRDDILNFLEKLYPLTSCFLNYKEDYQLLISIILSAQTTDKKVNDATSILFTSYPTIEDLSNADINDIIKIVNKLGLASTKARYVIDTCKIIINEFNGVVPSNLEDLLRLKGVGRKTACVFLAEYYNQAYIPVDTHIKRISKRLGLTKSDNPSLIQSDLEKIFYKEGVILHRRLILFGRNICKAINPKCDICKLKQYCNYSSLKVK